MPRGRRANRALALAPPCKEDVWWEKDEETGTWWVLEKDGWWQYWAGWWNMGTLFGGGTLWLEETSGRLFLYLPPGRCYKRRLNRGCQVFEAVICELWYPLENFYLE